jgi:hypothetical protein
MSGKMPSMSATDKKYFSRENISLSKFDASEGLAEQAAHCLELVAELVRAGLSFQFKGGNSLLLVLDRPRRFSIDVDIATDEPRERIEGCLDRLVSDFGVFTKWARRQHKTKPWLPLSSYYCFFNSHFVKSDDAFVMLDAQMSRSPYDTEFKPVRCGGLFQSDIKAEIPLPASIIGDKLLTLGPRTLGIPVGKGKDAQRLKHVFDVSLLLSANPRLGDIRKSLFACIGHENRLQEKSITVPQLLADTVAYCETTRKFTSPPRPDDSMDKALVENITGLLPFAGHLFSKKYGWDDLKRDLARVALVMTAACNGSVGEAEFKGILEQNANDAEYYWQSTGEWLKRI